MFFTNMDKIIVKGGTPLIGEIAISGSKNAALPIMAACLLTDEEVRINNIPMLVDITSMKELLAHHGAAANFDLGVKQNSYQHQILSIKADNITSFTAPYD